MFTSLIALTGWKAIGAIALLFGAIAPMVHAIFEFGARQDRRRHDDPPAVIGPSPPGPDRPITPEEHHAVTPETADPIPLPTAVPMPFFGPHRLHVDATRPLLVAFSVTALVLTGVVAGVVAGVAQRPFFGSSQREPAVATPKYDGRFTFARLKYTSGPGGYYYRGLPAWAHGYVPAGDGGRAEANLMKIMNEVSYLNPHIEESGVFGLDDPELFKYPLAYMAEPGFWTMGDEEAAGLRAYLLKGGFIIFDDFRADGLFNSGGGWVNFESNVRRALPELRLIELDTSALVFHSFFGIDSLAIIPQSYDRGRPAFFGLFEDNDPKKRMMAIVNYNTDVSDFWEFSATGFRPIGESNEAYKLGVNYIVYGMTH